MTKGFRLVMETFSDEADSILAGAEAESELFYTIFILLVSTCARVIHSPSQPVSPLWSFVCFDGLLL